MDKDAFLDRIAQRLGRPRLHVAPPRDAIGVPDFHRAEPLSGDSALLPRFCSELAGVGAEATVVRSHAELEQALRRIVRELAATRILSWARAELSEWRLDFLWSELGARAYLDPELPDEQSLKQALLTAEIGVTGADFAIAGSGSLALSAAPGRPRSLSLLPTVHVALLRSSQLVARLGQALDAYRARADLPSAIHFITGPSRTSDIENDLTIGVHGPAALAVIVLDDAGQAS